MSTLIKKRIRILTPEEKTEQKRLKRNRNYSIIYAYTKDSKLARKARDWGESRIEREVNGLKVPPRIVSDEIKKVAVIKSKGRKESTVYSDESPDWDYFEKHKKKLKNIADIKTRKKTKNNNYYKIAIENGYTPSEANKMKHWGAKHFFEVIDKKEVVDKEARKDRWSSMARRHKYDSELVREAERINLMNGFDVSDAYGWAVVYYWYTIGYTIQDWIKAIKPDRRLPEIYTVVGVIV